MQSQIEKFAAVSVTLEEDSEADPPDAEEPDEAETVVRPVSPEIVIGLTGSEDGLAQAEGLLSAAMEACESARDMGVGSIYVTGSESREREQLEQMVGYADKALERDCLMLHGQNVTSLTDTELAPALHVAIGARDRSDRPIPTQVFTSALARSKVAAEVDMWAFKQTLFWMVEHEDEVDKYAIVVIPLSSASMKDEELPHKIMSEFMETPVPPGKICFEIPDRDVVENVVEAGELINTLKEFGCRFVLDEFGSGHDNYDYVKELDVDFVTVKTGFVGDAQKNPKDFAMAKSINELVHFMGKKTSRNKSRVWNSQKPCARSASISYTISRSTHSSRRKAGVRITATLRLVAHRSGWRYTKLDSPASGLLRSRCCRSPLAGESKDSGLADPCFN